MKAKLSSAMFFTSVLLVASVAQAQYGPSPAMSRGMGSGMMPQGAGPMRGPGPGMQTAYMQQNPDTAGMAPGQMPMGAGPMGEYGGYNGESCGGGDSCGGGQGCGNTCGCDDSSCEFRCGWYGGGELLWFRPYFEHNTAYSLGTDSTLGNGNANSALSTTPFRYDFDIAPRFFVGWEDDCGFGYRGRYWQYKQDANEIVVTSPFDQAGTTFNILLPDDFANFSGLRQIIGFPGDIFTINSSLELHTIDTEFTQRFKWCCNDVQFGFGARLLRMVQRYDAEVVKNPNNFGGDFYRHQLKQEGAGPTVAFDLRHPVGCYGLSLLAGARFSVLFTRVDESVDYEVTNNNNSVVADGQFVRTEYEALAISEAKLGVEWKKCCCAGVEFFVDGTIEGQYWHGAGNALSTTTDLGMLGVGVSAGFHR